MKFIEWRWKKGLAQLLAAMRPAPEPQARRIVGMQLHIVLPAKAGVIGVVLYYLFSSGPLYEVTTLRGVVLEMLEGYFLIYILCNIVAGVVFALWRRFPPGIFQWLVFTLGLLDGLFMAGLAFITGGFESMAYWMFPGLIVLNAISIPLAMPQIVLNLILSIFYVSAGILDTHISYTQFSLQPVARRNTSHLSIQMRPTLPGGISPTLSATNQSTDQIRRFHRHSRLDDSGAILPEPGETPTEPFLLRVFVLWLLTACCYGVQALLERQRRATEEAREFEIRERQLRSAGRLAAEFAHQIKNPLAIINNAAFSLQRALKEGRSDVAGQIGIIQEEVERSDRIVTQIMGYAQLSEGRLEKLNLAEELDSAIEQVFPAAAGYRMRVARDYQHPFPPVLMQRRHLAEILVNLLQNSREALNGGGNVSVTARCRPDDSIEVSVADNGPGIPPDKLGKIFEAYYTTKEKGTGLGLAIVKHNLDLYAGAVWAESELGKGARFTLLLPTRAAVRLEKPK
jgi:signal transduction histidine kinase